MATLTEQLLVLLLLLVVYAYRPRPRADDAQIVQPLAPDAQALTERLRALEAHRSSSLAMRATANDGEALVRSASVFRADTPYSANDASPVQYRVMVKVERDGNSPPIVQRRFESPHPVQSTRPDNLAADVPPCQPPSTSLSTHARPHNVTAKNVSYDMQDITYPRIQRFGLVTPPSSVSRARAESEPVRAFGTSSIVRPPRGTQAVIEEEDVDRKVMLEMPTPRSISTPVKTPAKIAAKPATTKAPSKTTRGAGKKSAVATSVTGDPALVRNFRAFKNFAGVIGDDGQPVGNYWFKSESGSEIVAPPDFSTNPDVRLGDVYLHCSPTVNQFWHWAAGADHPKQPSWKSISLGYRRDSDSRRLDVTKVKTEPTWLV